MRPGGPGAFVLVAAGGAVGGLLRHAATLVAPDDPAGFGWTVLAINVVGSFGLGLLVHGLIPAGAPAWLRPALGTGLLGGFTTFSAVAMTSHLAASSGRAGLAVLHLLASVVLGVAAALLGVALGRRVVAGGQP